MASGSGSGDTVAVNGEVRRLEELRLQDFFQCFQFGAGFFETILVTGGAPMFLERHLARLRASLQAFPTAVKAPPPDTLTPEAVRLHRRFDALRFTVSELARRGRTGRKDHRLFTSQLTDLVTALLSAPVSDETRRLFRG